MVTERTRKKIVDKFMELAGETPWDDITMAAVAEHAGVDLATLRDAFDTKLTILEDFARRIDMAVLKSGDDDADEGARDRLFDVIMRRFDALAPYKAALKSLTRAARRDPVLAISFGRIASVSQAWMLTAAGIESGGLLGFAKVQGLMVAYGRVFRVWLKDDDPGLARTMSALDRELRRGETILTRVSGFMAPFAGKRRRTPEPAEDVVDNGAGAPA